MLAAKTLAAYLQSHPHIVRLVATGSPDGDLWQVESYSDSDWAGCLETRTSTDCHVIMVQGAIVQVTTQTQPGLPATSSPDAETTGSVSSHRKRNHLCARVAGKGLRNRMCQTKVVDRQFLSYASEQADRTWHQATTP